MIAQKINENLAAENIWYVKLDNMPTLLNSNKQHPVKVKTIAKQINIPSQIQRL